MDKLMFNVGTFPAGLSERRFELAPIDLDLAKIEIGEMDMIEVDLAISRTRDDFLVKGSVRSQVKQICVRCLEPMLTGLVAEFELFVRPCTTDGETGKRRKGEQAAGAVAEEFVSAPDGMLYHNGESFSLDEEVRQSLLVEIPGIPVCREGCNGLCPQCGANRGTGNCGCGDQSPADTRWAALQQLKDKESK